MEQNTRPGLANRMLWRFARKICLGFADAAYAFGPAKVEVTGNPIRFSKQPQPPQVVGAPARILILGGSSGAHRLNLGVISAFELLHKDGIEMSITHQTGEADAESVEEAYRTLGNKARVVPFIDDIAEALESADLVISRAGAMTVSEIALVGRAAVFVPYPFHRDHQQEHNAQVLIRLGGAVVVRDDEHLGENLALAMRRLNARPECLPEMGRRAHLAAIDDAATRIAHLCFEVATDRTGDGPRSARTGGSAAIECHQVRESSRCSQEKAGSVAHRQKEPTP
jgi:UDP-N-acetylglucosamine--N-acetylmuramyl-(pentapeptide) pyrophosphoryl-undecaprenol N-acetylglucosamine transferase